MIDIIAAIITEAGALQCQVGVESVSGSFLKKKESMFKYINLSEINNKNVRSCQYIQALLCAAAMVLSFR